MNMLEDIIYFKDRFIIQDVKSNDKLDKRIIEHILQIKFRPNELLTQTATLNRIDIAEGLIKGLYKRFYYDPKLISVLLIAGKLYQDAMTEDMMSACLMNEKIEFIKLLIENGFSMQRFLTVENLRRLYTESVSH